MKHLFRIALAAFAILAACTDDIINIAPYGPDPPTNDSVPPPPPQDSTPPPPQDSTPPPPIGGVWADTAYKTPLEEGYVSAPCIYVSTSDNKSHEISVQKYNLQGTARKPVVLRESRQWPYVLTPAFSADGIFMTHADQEGLFVKDTRSNTQKFICNINGRSIFAAEFSPDNALIAIGAGLTDDIGGDLYLVENRSGATPVNVTRSADNEILSYPAFSPDGKMIAYATWGTLYVTDLGGNQRIEVQKDYGFWNDMPRFTRDGRSILYASYRYGWQESEIYIADVAEGAETNARRLTEARKYGLKSATAPVMSPDGGTIYFLGETFTGYVHLYSMPASGGNFEMVAPCVAYKDQFSRLTFVQ